MIDNYIALFVNLHPASFPKRATLLDNLRRGARDYYRRPSSHCVAWSYLLPWTLGDEHKDDNELDFLGLEIYTSKSALQQQLDDTTFFQPFEDEVVKQQLYSRESLMLAWYLQAGFVTRNKEREEGGGGVVARVWQLTCISEEKSGVIKALGEFAGWSRWGDPGVLTFAIFTRPKGEKQILVYVRYRDATAMARVEERPEYQNFWKLALSMLESDDSKTSSWREVDDSFVSPLTEEGQGTTKL